MYEATIQTILVSLAPCYAETRPGPWYESPEVRLARLALVAKAIGSVARTIDDVAGLITIAEFEAGYSLRVQAGAIPGLGRGLWGIEPGSNRLPPFEGLGLDATTHAAGEALWLWRHSYQHGANPEARFASYAGLSQAHWSGAAPRARFFRWVAYRVVLAQQGPGF